MALKVIISGGGTGGHIFPAIAIANELKRIQPDVQILFVGAEGRMEMEKVPAAGYQILGLPIMGLQRRLTLQNLKVPFKVAASILKARKIILQFKPDIAIGVGGYASGPLLRVASFMGVKTMIQEQNSFPGITNKILAPKAERICVAYEGMEKFFPVNKIMLTGNPVRKEVWQIDNKAEKAIEFFNLVKGKKTILVIGGSLGARSINKAIDQHCNHITNQGFQIIWQTGKNYQPNTPDSSSLRILPFIKEMDLAYAAADIIISRAGAMSISELCLVGKPCILIPSPNVAEDHQTKNAIALVEKNAALLIKDHEASSQLADRVLSLANNTDLMKELSVHIRALGKENADEIIAQQIIQICNS